MARRQPPPEQPIASKEFTSDEIDRGIEKLKRRVQELSDLDPSVIRHDDASIENLTHRIRESIREVFGDHSPEFDKYKYIEISRGFVGFSLYADQGTVERQRQQQFADGIPHTIKILEGLIEWLCEKRADLGLSPNRKIDINGTDLHQRIADVCKDLYQDGHYADAVFNASQALVNYVKERSGNFELDGASLMRTVFSKNSPSLAFNELRDQSDLDEQEGMMHLFEGAVLALRNPRGHSFRYDTPEKALEYISFLSMLAKRLTDAKRRK